MAKSYSFDVVSRVDRQEVQNAVEQTHREVAQRFDFKGATAEVHYDAGADTLELLTDSDFRLENLAQVLEARLIKRQVDLRSIERGAVRPAGGDQRRQEWTLRQGLSPENQKAVQKAVRELGKKLKVEIQSDALRVFGENKDDLQLAIATIKGLSLDQPVQFVNLR